MVKQVDETEAVDTALAATAWPVVIADMWDNPGGGTAGDATVVLAELIRRGAEDVAVGTIWDPIAVQVCMAAGEGAKIPLRFGAKSAPETGSPIDKTVTIRRLVRNAEMKFGDSQVPFGDAASISFEGIDVILNSTREGLRLYEQLGFVAYGQVIQHQAVLAAAPPKSSSNGVVRPLRAEDIAQIRDLDRRASGMGRARLLDALFAVGQVAVIECEGRVYGYACVRKFGRGVVLGPVVAHDTTDAIALIATLAADHRGGFVRIDVPATSGLSSWLDEIGLPQVDHVASMARGKPPIRAAGATLFALSNQSLG